MEAVLYKPVSKFAKNATLGQINSKKNLVPLCPNHHWDLDHGKLDIGSIA
jgi:hypothetical protein